jgi:hypothetical protein
MRKALLQGVYKLMAETPSNWDHQPFQFDNLARLLLSDPGDQFVVLGYG